MLDKNGCVCEYDGYIIPEPMPDSPERRRLHQEAVEEGKRLVERIKQQYGFNEVEK